jgi:phosphoribosylaminoimidazolecarboxamide formyltransferase/IMP cyclohydrolase
MIQRALLSVYNKDGIVNLARALHATYGVELLSTGGTAALLESASIPFIPVSDFTGFPEMFDGRVKTLHPKVHGGLLFVRDNPEHVNQAKEHGILPIDLLVLNLYPFQKTVDDPRATHEDIIEMIDIGGPGMLRSAAKNHESVTVIEDLEFYRTLLQEMEKNKGDTTLQFREMCAKQVFRLTSQYDARIAAYLSNPRKV